MRKDAQPLNPLDFANNLVGEAPYRFSASGKKYRQVLLVCCVCSHQFTADLYNAKRIKQRTCSDQCAGVLRQKEDYCAVQHPLYKVWGSMKNRCNNPNHSRHSRYGARGITYSSVFQTFDKFLKIVQALPNYPYHGSAKSSLYTLDRINNDIGYVEGNLRWACPSTQAANKTFKKPNTSSSYIGVCFSTTDRKWLSCLQWKGKKIYTYRGLSEFDAYLARKAFIEKHELPHAI